MATRLTFNPQFPRIQADKPDTTKPGALCDKLVPLADAVLGQALPRHFNVQLVRTEGLDPRQKNVRHALLGIRRRAV